MGAILCKELEDEKRDMILDYVPSLRQLESLSCFFSAFSDSTRLKIISALSISSMCVGDIAMLLKINQTTLSHQLAILKNLNIVQSSREGKTIFYSLANKNVNDILLFGANNL